MTLPYELAVELKEAGFPQHGQDIMTPHTADIDAGRVSVYYPTLEELVEACGERPIRLQSYWDGNELHWQADTCGNFKEWEYEKETAEIGPTPRIAVARLWLALNRNK